MATLNIKLVYYLDKIRACIEHVCWRRLLAASASHAMRSRGERSVAEPMRMLQVRRLQRGITGCAEMIRVSRIKAPLFVIEIVRIIRKNREQPIKL